MKPANITYLFINDSNSNSNEMKRKRRVKKRKKRLLILFVLSCKETIESTMVTKITFRIFFAFCKKSLNKYLRTTENNVFSCHCRVAHHDGLQKPVHLYMGFEIHVLLELFLQMGKDRAEIMQVHVSNQRVKALISHHLCTMFYGRGKSMTAHLIIRPCNGVISYLLLSYATI